MDIGPLCYAGETAQNQTAADVGGTPLIERQAPREGGWENLNLSKPMSMKTKAAI